VIEIASNYLATGLCVLPAVRAEKRPALSGWKAFQSGLPTPQQVEHWFGGDIDALCIVAGSVSDNLEVIDFDCEADQFSDWAALIPVQLLSRLAIERTQSGGRHVIYRVAEPICGNMKLSQAQRDGKVVTLIETRGEGGLFLCAPTPGYTLEQGSLADLPVLSAEERELLLEAAWSLNQYQVRPVGPAAATDTYDQLRPGDHFNQRGEVRDVLRRHGWTLVRSGQNEYWRRPNKTSGWSATFKDRVFYVFSANAAPFEPNHAYSPFAVFSFLEYGGDYEAAAKGLRTEGFGSDEVVCVPYSTPPVICSDDDLPSPEPIALANDPGPMPEHMLRIPGFISEVMDYCLATAPYPNQVMAFSGALSLQAFLAGRKVRDPGDNRTNLYLLGLAHSAAGKDWPRKINTRILHEIGLADCTGERFASGEGIQDALFLSPSMLFQTDEIDGMLQSINKSRDARHENIMTTLLTFYSSANSVYPMRRKAGKESPGSINQPSLVIFGTAIPNHYYEALSERMLTNGFFARMIILECGRRGTGQEPTIAEIPYRVLETARWWNDYRPGEGNLQDWHPIPAVVPHTDEARQILVSARMEAEAEYERAENSNDAVGTTVWGRVSEQSRKLALLYAISQDARSPEIGRGAAAWAVAFVIHQTRRMLCMAGRHVSRNDFDAMAKEMLRVLRSWRDKRGNKPMPEWELTRRLPWKPSDHDDVIKLLRKQKLVDCGPSPSKTKPGTIYWLVES
jgi:hypothetical protein